MPDNAESFLGLTPPAPDALPTPPPTPAPAAARRVRFSLVSFLVGLAALILGVVLLACSIRPGGFLFNVDDTLFFLALISVVGGVISWLTSLISGLTVVKRRPVVLWWLVPILLPVVGIIVLVLLE
jgi:hypothetical protein